MTNMVRKCRFSIGIGEMHSTYRLLESIKGSDGLSDPFLESMRISLKRKLMEEEEGLLTIAYEVRATPKPRKYGMEGLGFATQANNSERALDPTASNFDEVFLNQLNERLASDDPPIIAEIPNTNGIANMAGLSTAARMVERIKRERELEEQNGNDTQSKE